jgi:hypothetical protein
MENIDINYFNFLHLKLEGEVHRLREKHYNYFKMNFNTNFSQS